MADLSVVIAGLYLENPVMLASGFVFRPDTIRRCAGYGFGAIVPKTLRRHETQGHEPPIFAMFEDGGINAVGLSCPGIDNYVPWYEEYAGRIRQKGTPIIFSVKPEALADMLYVVRRIKPYASAIELNGSCPNVPGGMQLCQSPQLIREGVDAIKQEIGDMLLLFKESPNADVVGPAHAAKAAGAGATVLINTVLKSPKDPDTGWPLTSYGSGGVSGKPILEKGLQCVRALYESGIGTPIIGCGGISGWQDMVKYFRAGADAVQWGTELFLNTPLELEYGGKKSVKTKVGEALDGLDGFMEDYGSFREFLGRCRHG